MEEPKYIAQTFEAEHLESSKSSYCWFEGQAHEAAGLGCIFCRMTINDRRTGLLFEAWVSNPLNQGEPRWQLVKGKL